MPKIILVSCCSLFVIAIVVIATTISFLQMEGLLLTERGTALVAWLSFVVTTGAFAAALTALFIALRQLKQATEQFTHEKMLRSQNKHAEISKIRAKIVSVVGGIRTVIEEQFQIVENEIVSLERKKVDFEEIKEDFVAIVTYFQNYEESEKIKKIIKDKEFYNSSTITYGIINTKGKLTGKLSTITATDIIRHFENTDNGLVKIQKELEKIGESIIEQQLGDSQPNDGKIMP